LVIYRLLDLINAQKMEHIKIIKNKLESSTWKEKTEGIEETNRPGETIRR